MREDTKQHLKEWQARKDEELNEVIDTNIINRMEANPIPKASEQSENKAISKKSPLPSPGF